MIDSDFKQIMCKFKTQSLLNNFRCADYTISWKDPDRSAGMDVEATKRNICEIIDSKGLKDKVIAEKLGITPQAVNKWRHKGTFLVIDNLYILSGMLGISIDELIVPNKWNEGAVFVESR